MRRPIIVAGVLALTLAVPAVAGAAPNVPDDSLAKSVLPIDTGTAVRGIDLSEAVLPLEDEHTSGAQVTVRISADVLFDFGESTLTDAARRRVAALAPRFRDTKATVRIAGHSDSIGDPSSNLALSEERAEAVKTELQRALNGEGPKIEARGYGEAKPVAPNEQGGKDDPEGRAKNRRVEITYEKA